MKYFYSIVLLSFLSVSSLFAYDGNIYQTCSTTGCNLTYNFSTGTSDMPTCATASLIVESAGDFGSSTENFTVFGEGGANLGTAGTVECGSSFPTETNVFEISGAQINSWNNDGTITITLDASSAVNTFSSGVCTNASIQANVILTYDDEMSAVNETAPTCSNNTIPIGYGGYELFGAIDPSTYYDISWSNNGNPSINGFCGVPTNGNASTITSNTTCWFSGTTGTVDFYANVVNGTYNTNSGILTYRETQPIVNAGSNQNTCNGSYDINPTVNCSDNVSFSKVNGSGSVNSSTGLVTGVGTNSSGTYRVTVINGDCSATDDIIIYNRTPTTPSSSGAGTICFGGSRTLTASGSAASGGFTYYLQTSPGGTSTANAGSSVTVSPSSTTTYYFRARSTISNCWSAASNSVTVTVEPQPSAATATRSPNDSEVCEGQNLTLTNINSGSGGANCSVRYRYSTNGGSSYSSWSSTIPSFAATGTDNNIIQIQRNCTGSGCYTITTSYVWSVVPDPSISILGGVNQSICSGTNGNTFTALISGGVGCGYQWQQSNDGISWSNISGATSSTYTPTGLTASTFYRCSTRNCASGCNQATSQERFIAVTPVPTIQTQPTPTNLSVCEGTNVSYSTQANLGTGSTKYRLVLTSAHGAGWHGIQEIQGYNISGNQVTLACEGASSSTYTDVMCNASGGTYSADNAFDGVFNSGSSSTVQWLTPKNNGPGNTNYQNYSTFNPFYSPEWIEFSSPQPLSEIWVYNGRYAPSSGDISDCFKDYYVLVSYDNGATWNKVKEGAFNAVNGIDGNNNKLNIEPNYTWKKGATTVGTGKTLNLNSVSASDAGTYNAELDYGCGTASSTNVNLVISSGLSATANVTAPTCNGNCNGSVDFDITGGIAPYQIDKNTFGLCAGAQSYTITDAIGCSISVNATVPAAPSPLSLTATVTNESCPSACDGSISLSGSGGTAPYTFAGSSIVTDHFSGNDEGLILHLPLDNSTEDISPTAQAAGANSGVTFPGDGSADFSSSTGINMGAKGAPYLTAATTISYWIYSNNISSPSRQNPFDQAYGGWGTQTLETNGSISWFFGSNGGNAQSYGGHGSPAGTVTSGQWIHIACTRNPATNTFTWYKNGSILSSGAYNSTYPVINNRTLTIGDGYVNSINGKMSDFRIYNRVLSANEVAEIHSRSQEDYIFKKAGGTLSHEGGVIRFNNDNDAWDMEYYTKETHARVPGKTFQGQIKLDQLNPSRSMIGWRDQGTNGNTYFNLVYAIYFNNGGGVNIYENGANKGSVGSFTFGQWYDIKIELLATGAIYYMKAAGSSTWTTLYTSAYSSHANLSPGVSHLGQAGLYIDNWNVNDPMDEISGLCDGNYSYTVIDANGCTSNNSFNVGTDKTLSTTPSSAIVSTSTICTGASVSLGVSGGSLGTGASWEWYSGSCGGTSEGSTTTTLSVSPTSTTTYYVRAEGDCNSTSPCRSVTVNVFPDPSVTINGSNTTACQGFNPGTLTASPSGGTGGTSYQWRLNGSNISGATSSTYNPPALNTPGTYNYTVVYNRTGSGCGAATSNTRTYTIVADPSVSISGGGSTSGCVGLDPSSLTSSISGGTGSSTYQWQLNGSNISGATGSTYNPPALNSPGTYTYRVIHNRSGSDCGQATSNTITFNVSDDPTSPTLNSKSPNAASVCEGTNVSATFNSGSGGTGCSDQYRVSTNGGSSWNSYSPGSNISTSGLGGNQVIIQSRRLCSGNGCDGSGEVYATVASWNIDSDPATANNTTSTTAICETQTKSLTASPSGGSWSVVSGGGGISGSTYTPANISSNTSVTVRYTVSSNGACSGSTDDITFTVNANPATANNTTDNSTLCEGVDRQLNGSPSGGAWSLIAGSGSISGSSYNTGSLSTNETVTIRYTVSSNGACSGSTNDVSFTANSDNNTSSTWTGAVNSDWHNPENWTNCLPGNNTDVIIPSNPSNQPVVYANGTNMSNGLGECNTIEVQSGASIRIKTSAQLKVNE